MAATDPTFYRTPGAAVAAAPEQLAYVAAFDPAGQAKDAIAVVDCDPDSSTYGGVVGWAELPTAGNELHHFGWNACSSALCHDGHGGHQPGTGTARTPLPTRTGHPLVDHLRPRHQARPSPPGADAHDRGRRTGGQGRILAPAHGALRAGRHLHVGAGWRRRRRRSRRHRADRPRHVRGHRTVGGGPRTAVPRVRRVVAPELRHRDHLGVGDAVDDRERTQSRGPARTQVRTPPELLEHVRAQADPARRPR